MKKMYVVCVVLISFSIPVKMFAQKSHPGKLISILRSKDVEVVNIDYGRIQKKEDSVTYEISGKLTGGEIKICKFITTRDSTIKMIFYQYFDMDGVMDPDGGLNSPFGPKNKGKEPLEDFLKRVFQITI